MRSKNMELIKMADATITESAYTPEFDLEVLESFTADLINCVQAEAAAGGTPIPLDLQADMDIFLAALSKQQGHD